MQNQIAAGSFTRLADDLKRPFVPPPQARKSPVPLPEKEMIARYGMRQLTAEEKSRRKKRIPWLDVGDTGEESVHHPCAIGAAPRQRLGGLDCRDLSWLVHRELPRWQPFDCALHQDALGRC